MSLGKGSLLLCARIQLFLCTARWRHRRMSLKILSNLGIFYPSGATWCTHGGGICMKECTTGLLSHARFDPMGARVGRRLPKIRNLVKFGLSPRSNDSIYRSAWNLTGRVNKWFTISPAKFGCDYFWGGHGSPKYSKIGQSGRAGVALCTDPGEIWRGGDQSTSYVHCLVQNFPQIWDV